MTHNWFECKVRYEKTMENGFIKKVNEPYLVDALSFTEAEARIIEEMQPYISGEFSVSGIKRANYGDLFDEQGGDKYYDIKVCFVAISEKTLKEEKTYSHYLVLADNTEMAQKNLDKGLDGINVDYTVASIRETMIMDVFPFDENKDSGQTVTVKVDLTKPFQEAWEELKEEYNKKKGE